MARNPTRAHHPGYGSGSPVCDAGLGTCSESTATDPWMLILNDEDAFKWPCHSAIHPHHTEP